MMVALNVAERDIVRFVSKEVGYIPVESDGKVPLNRPIFLHSSEGLYEVIATDAMYITGRWMTIAILTISDFKMVL